MIDQLIQARGEVAYQIANEGINIHKDIENPLVKNYWKLSNMIDSIQNFYWVLEFKNKRLFFETYEELADFTEMIDCDFTIRRPRKENNIIYYDTLYEWYK